MAIITLRLNEDEERALNLLVQYLGEDKSKILKQAMWEKLEELRERELIEDFEKKSLAGKVQFESADDLILKLEEKAPPYNLQIKPAASDKAPARSRKRGKGS